MELHEQKCSKCKTNKPIDQFYPRPETKRGYRRECKKCQLAQKHKTQYQYNNSLEGKLTKRNHLLKERHSIDSTEYERMLKIQRGRCAICFELPESGKKLDVDHDHRCCPQNKSCGKCIRGLLCRRCNVGMGLLGDSILVFQEVIRYLENHGK